MVQPYVFRMMTSGVDAWKLSIQVAETMIASQMVITMRLGMIGGGLTGFAKPPMAELNRLIPEKTVAFTRAGSAATRAMTRRRAQPATLSSALLADSMIMLDWWERSLDVASAWWLPVHGRATANAKRLSAFRF